MELTRALDNIVEIKIMTVLTLQKDILLVYNTTNKNNILNETRPKIIFYVFMISNAVLILTLSLKKKKINLTLSISKFNLNLMSELFLSSF